jgi:hypothetical protein
MRAASGEDPDLIVRLLRKGYVLVSGIGGPVTNIDWRTGAEHRERVLAYEEGAGVFIGKAFRDEPRVAFALLRSRLDELRHASNGGVTGETSIRVRSFFGALTRGLIVGIRLKPWAGSPADRPGASPIPPWPMKRN